MKFRYLIATPFAVNLGGTSIHAESVINQIAQQGYEIKPVDYMKKEIDFDVLLVVSFSYHNPDMLEKYRAAGVKIVLIPIFDRTKPEWSFKVQNLFENTPIRTLFNQRKRILDSADLIIVCCQAEKNDLISCFKSDSTKIIVDHLGINTDVLDLDKTTDSSWFEDQFGKGDYIIFSAAEINVRKNQMAIVKAIQNTEIKLILTGTHQVRVEGFWEEVHKNKNIVCLGEITLQNLVSAYKSSKVSVSASSTETAGLAPLESAYFGCNLVVSDISPFREYVGEIASFFDKDLNSQDIVAKLQKALEKPKNYGQKQFIEQNYSWEVYVKSLIAETEKLFVTKE